MWMCQSCGSNNSDNANFCSNCGARNTHTDAVSKSNDNASRIVKTRNIIIVLVACITALSVLLIFTINKYKKIQTDSKQVVERADANATPTPEMAAGIAIDNNHFPDAVFHSYIAENCDTDKDGFLSKSEVLAVNTVDVSYLGIEDLTGIEYFTALTNLRCTGNQLTRLNMSANQALKTLHCDYNQLRSLDVHANPALEWLICDGNQLTSLDVRANTALEWLSCESNQLTSLNVSANKALTNLNCEGNLLRSLDVNANRALSKLNCSFNQLTILDVSANPALEQLKCYNNRLTSLDVSANPVLDWLECGSIQLITKTGEISTGSKTDKPSSADLDAINTNIVYPKKEEYYLSEYITKYIRASSNRRAVYAFINPNIQNVMSNGNYFTVSNGTEVTVIAQSSGYACVIIPSMNKAGWINSKFLIDG